MAPLAEENLKNGEKAGRHWTDVTVAVSGLECLPKAAE